ncbi:MAG: FkbM family methyltransferase [Anaerolineae bacterium]|nr:FkbM family methyltransferase [Anaerolineae bacterium]
MRYSKLAPKIIRRFYVKLKLLNWEIIRRFRKFITIRTKQGRFTIRLGAEESIGRSLFVSGQYELDLMLSSITLLRSINQLPAEGKGTVIDVGANIGIISIGMLQKGQMEKAIAFEPEPYNFSLLQQNVTLNGLDDRFVCYPYAASDQVGESLFELSKTNFGDHRIREAASLHSSMELQDESTRATITVECKRLDDLVPSFPASFAENIALMWIDVQGWEGYVFLGAKNLLSKGIPVVSEIWPYGIRRAGMSQEKFCEIAGGIWRHYWVKRRKKFVCYPIETLNTVFEELGYDGSVGNVIFTQ